MASYQTQGLQQILLLAATHKTARPEVTSGFPWHMKVVHLIQ